METGQISSYKKQLGESKVENQRLVFEIRNIAEQKIWAERQIQKLEKQLKQQAVAGSDKKHSIIDERRKLKDLEKKLRSESTALQHQLRKLTTTLKAKETKINELNTALKSSPKRKTPITVETIQKPMMTKFFDEGRVSFDAFAAVKAQENAEGYFIEASQREIDLLKNEISTACDKLSRVVEDNRDEPVNPVDRLRAIVDQICSNAGSSVNMEECYKQKQLISGLQKELEIANKYWKESDRRVDELLAEKA